MKKLLALLLAVVMVLALCACGAKTEEPAPAAEEAPAAEAPAAEAPAAEAPAAPAAEPSAVEPLEITFSTTFQETATGGELVTYFKNALESATDGAITVTVYYGGTLFADADALDGVATGAVNMTALGHNPHAAKLPLLCGVPDFAPDSVQNALDYFNYLLKGNPESAAALEAEATANNVKFLGALAGGANAFVANFDFDNLTDLIAKSRAFGNMEAAKFSALGFTVEAVLPWELYQNFESGKMDATQMASTSMLQDGVAEVTSTWMYDNTYTAGNFMTVNLDWWNGLSAAQQDAIQAAVDATAAYSVEVYTSALESEATTLTENYGIKIAEMTADEFDQWWSVIMESKKADTMATAETNGNVEAAQAVLGAAAEFTGYDIEF
ncbi:MAG: TRAP transporter substrate-binding protein [Oscillospiraceae bacterium]